MLKWYDFGFGTAMGLRDIESTVEAGSVFFMYIHTCPRTRNCYTPSTCFVVEYKQLYNGMGTETDIICIMLIYLTE